MARLTKALIVLAPLLAAGVTLSSCGSGGAVDDARRSCHSVHRALLIERRSEAPGLSARQRTVLQEKALSALLLATSAAAQATSIDGSWNPLMTTINEAERVPLKQLIPALTRLCQLANSATPYL